MKPRSKQFDAARGILILLVLAGHCWTSGWFREFIYVFHMPAFFLLSGVLLQRSSSLDQPLWKTLLKKARSLLIPYFFFECFSILLNVLTKGPELNVKGYLYQILTLKLTNGPLWFLVVLFCAECLFLLLWKLQRPWILISAGAVLFALSFFLPKSQAFISPVMINTALLFLLIGYFAHKPLSSGPIWVLPAALAVTALLAAVNPVEINCYQDGIPGLFFLSGFSGALVVFQLGRYLQWKPLLFYGKNSLIILGTHYPLLRALKLLLPLHSDHFMSGLILFLLLLLLEVPLVLLIDRCFPFLLGRWYSGRKHGAETEGSQACEGSSAQAEKKKKRALRRRILLLSAILLVLLGVLEGILSNTVLTVNRYTFSSPKLAQPMRIVLLSDLHGREYGAGNRRLLDAVAAQEPDMIALVGDFFDETMDETEIDAICGFIHEVSAIAPVYFGIGNHERNVLSFQRDGFFEAHDSPLAHRIEDAGAVILESEFLDLTICGNEIRLGGYMGYYRQPGMMAQRREDIPLELAFADEFENTERFKLLLNHIPTTWLDWHYVEKHPVDLALCGHYHGGVVRIPFLEQGLAAPYVGWFPPYTKGLFRGSQASCILTTGLAGYGKIPRFFNFPEVCVIDLIPD